MPGTSSEDRPGAALSEPIFDISTDPFSHQRLAKIFKTHPGTDRLVSRESSTLEFKKSFNWNSRDDYARTLAGFANAVGGYIVFGIGDKPRKLIGLTSSRFEETDPAEISQYLNDVFSPELRWQVHVHDIGEQRFGIIFVHESTFKPVVCTKNLGVGGTAADIYFRYRGRTEKIRYPELRQILNEQRDREHKTWMDLIGKISRAGVKNAAIFDSQSGIVSGSGGSFVIDSSLLPNLTFIREGEFQERTGAPAVRIVGRAEIVDSNLIQPVRTLSRTVAIRSPEIVHAFLEGRRVSEPKQYIAQICYEASAYFPVYYYIRQAGLNLSQSRDFIEEVQSRYKAKQKLLERLASDDHLALSLPSETRDSGRAKNRYRQLLLQGDVAESVPISDLHYVLQAIRTLAPNQIRARYLRDRLKTWFDKFYAHNDGALADDLRRSIAFLDRVLNREEAGG